MGYEHLITVEPGKRSGKPCIRGMRIPIDDVLEDLASRMTEDKIPADFCELTREDIKACLPSPCRPRTQAFNYTVRSNVCLLNSERDNLSI